MIHNYKKFLENKANDFQNLEIYLKKMARGLEDKIFFFNIIHPNCIVDFGCADGSILKKIAKFHPNIKLIGYDYDRNLLELIDNQDNIIATNKWGVASSIARKYDSSMVLLSSVIHEVYSYGNDNSVNRFWENIFSNNFKYVSIRDMMYSAGFKGFDEDDIIKIKDVANKKQLISYEKVWGPVDQNYRNTIHWLLKYPYVDNWERELHENYLPLSIEELKNKIPAGWSILYEDFHILGHVQRKIKREIDVDLIYPTHIKMIVQNNNI